MWTLRRTPTTHLLFTPVPHSHNAPRTTLGVAARAKTHTAKDRVANVLPTPTGLPTFCQRRAARMQPRFQMYPTAGGPARDPPNATCACYVWRVCACVRAAHFCVRQRPKVPHVLHRVVVFGARKSAPADRRKVAAPPRRARPCLDGLPTCGRRAGAPRTRQSRRRTTSLELCVWACTLRLRAYVWAQALANCARAKCLEMSTQAPHGADR